MKRYYVEFAEPHSWINYFGKNNKANRRNWKLADVKDNIEEAKSLAQAIRWGCPGYLTKIKAL